MTFGCDEAARAAGAATEPVPGLPWSDIAPVRAELFSVERLEQHAVTLAAAQAVAVRPRRVPPLQRRLDDNAAQLLAAYRAHAREIAAGRQVVPAADWLLDNYHLVEAQIREIRIDLPPGYYRLLPKLESGPFAGYPRVFGIAWAYVAHTDSHFDPEVLRRFLAAYQTVQPLIIGELWAVAITLRIVLVENLRRLADQMTRGRARRLEADLLADRICAPGQAHTALFSEIERRSTGPLSEVFAAQLAKRLRDRDPRTNPALGWLEERLATQGASIDSVVRHAQERQGASNVTLRNVITSMRAVSETDWSDLFESVSLVEARLRDHAGYGAMDFPSRNLYRSAVEDLARGCELAETTVAAQAVILAKAAADPRAADPGWHLIAGGRRAFEAGIGFRPPARLRLRRWGIAAGIGGYAGMILGMTVLLVGLSVWALSGAGVSLLWALAALFPASAVAVAVIDRVVASGIGAALLPGLELKEGVPPALRTLVAVPVLMTDAEDLRAQIEALEVHHLSGTGGDLTFALLTDGLDAPAEVMPGDAALLALATDGIAALNRRHPPGPSGARFLHLNRVRRFNASEGVWMGWERKRGKLHELNRLLRGVGDTGYVTADGQVPTVPADVRYVITLDADTRMPRDAAARLIGKIAHPLNSPVLDRARGRVTEGHAILQPRVTPALAAGHAATLYQRATSGPGGMDPYAAAASDVYQDLFGEGSFTGKGIYDIDAFEAAMEGRVPENTLLSHDLLEGIFARAGLASDVEVVEAFPDRHDVAARRQHRWTRGDWQLLPWLRAPGTPLLGRFKMADNLRRSLVAPFTLAALALGWLMPGQAAVVATALVLGAMAFPALLPAVLGVIPRRKGLHAASHLRQSGRDLGMAGVQTFLAVTFLADTAWRMTDAILRSFWRLGVSRRHLLEWTTAAQSAGGPRPGLTGVARAMAGGMCLGTGLATGAALLAPASLPLALPFALLWLAAPVVALRISRSSRTAQDAALQPETARDLRLIARTTWGYFETFVTAADSHLPPDNFQEDPSPLVARRTSPTNMGLYLLSAVAARDFGWAGLIRTTERIEATLATMQALPKINGHFYNWYGTADGRVLEPLYISSVDSGNLAGHLIALANACEAWAEDPAPGDIRTGLLDTLHLVRAAAGTEPPLDDLLSELEAAIAAPAMPGDPVWPALLRLAAKAQAAAPPGDRAADLRFRLDALCEEIAQHARDADPEASRDLPQRLTALAAQARAMALAMDFGFLLDPDRKLLSIGWAAAENALDPSCYDLLASEARLASLFAIAKGDVPLRHWFRLGRAATPLKGGAALVSWSGSMFEYLMPALVMSEPEGSLLAQTNRLVLARQQKYGRLRDVPWGVSESGFNARDMELNYQYSTFGIPGLGLKRGLAADLVIAPYATGLAAMIDPDAARRNYAALAMLGGLGRFGFFEALDFTPSRLPEGEAVALVCSYMAHHQGMTIVAIANALQGGRMRARFHAEPMIRAAELLLQERIPRDIANAHPRAEEIAAPATPTAVDMQRMTLIEGTPQGPPVTHLMSNGRYSVMLTARGGGYSRWGAIALTRWQADATRDTGGMRFWLRDLRSGAVHAIAGAAAADHNDVQFFEDRATFSRHDGTLATLLDIVVSGEDDAEVRRVSVTSTSRRPREIELTSYAELVLTTPATDEAHPAFAKMFVQTEYLPEFGALIATRRSREPGEPGVWAAHFVVVEGEPSAALEYETDRAAFLGRDNDVPTARAVTGGAALGGGIGTVLDPVFALRQRVRIAPGGTARLAFWTLAAPTREELLDLIDRHHDRNAYDRAKTLAWTLAQVQLRHLGVDAARAGDFQRLAAPILYHDARFRAAPGAILNGAGKQSELWPLAISGDLPIVLLRIHDRAEMAQVQEMLLAHEYWRMKRLDVDLVILNEHPASYVQSLQAGIETAVRSSRARSGEDDMRGAVHALRADLMTPGARALLTASARVVLVARRGALGEQIAGVLVGALSAPAGTPVPAPAMRRAHAPPAPAPVADPAVPLEFFNGTGGFDRGGREYVTILEPGASTPAPWVNVIANDGFGFHVSATGSTSTWAENSRENRLTPWSNDPVADPTGEAFYIRDEATGELFSPTARPLRRPGLHVARHGFGYSRFQHEASGIALDLLQYVPLADPVKISRLTLRNLSGRRRRLTVFSYAEPVMGLARAASAPFITTERDAETGALFARNPWAAAFPDRVMFADLGESTGFTTDRTGFLGHGGDLAAPLALSSGLPLSGAAGAGMDPCLALSCTADLAPGASVEVAHFLGQTDTAAAARALIGRLRRSDPDTAIAGVEAHWAAVVGTVQIETPDRAMDIMVNGWLQYQTLACRMQARAGFYQASGAYGFRDQLQDGMALTLADPARVRAHLLRAAGRQFPEGDVQHWWLPHSGQGVRTRISDDCVWLGYAVADYVATTGDVAVLEEKVPFLEGPPLAPGEQDAFFLPDPSGREATLFEHCALGLDRCIVLTGPLGLPLIGTGDWNDGMNRVGEGGRGESVWLGWLLLRTLALFAPLAETREPARAGRWRAHGEGLRAALEREAWDGEWYRRATFDDGSWLGSAAGGVCRIDSIAQSWAVLSGQADPARAATAMRALERELIRPGPGIALLFTPPFDSAGPDFGPDPGYIAGYPPGLRENGGQYSHAAMWAILARAQMGDGDGAARLFAMLNPINHALTHADVLRYKVEPYVVAADVYSVAPHEGRGGWTWYTGSAAWMYRAAVEGILGLRREGGHLRVDPCLPANWPGFSARVRVEGTRVDIRVTQAAEGDRVVVDGVARAGRTAWIALDSGAHVLDLRRRSPGGWSP